ncbi:hypothetical protein QUF76_02130 [Desulfobacterales bacterium HSG16]|nr:hypothetical protein [Desulfobacterales bacterium HSG16]
MKRILLIALISMAAGCGPQFKTFTTYTPPADPEGMRCVDMCQHEKSICTRECRYEYRICKSEARQEARDQLIVAMQDHDEDMRRWDRKVRECQRRKPPKGCNGIKLERPERPELKDFLSDSHCSENCSNCPEEFEICFQACGGNIYRETRCVSNCDK